PERARELEGVVNPADEELSKSAKLDQRSDRVRPGIALGEPRQIRERLPVRSLPQELEVDGLHDSKAPESALRCGRHSVARGSQLLFGGVFRGLPVEHATP